MTIWLAELKSIPLRMRRALIGALRKPADPENVNLHCASCFIGAHLHATRGNHHRMLGQSGLFHGVNGPRRR